MGVTCGFYNSLNHDRKYDAAQVGQIFDGIINDGVYAAYEGSLIVKAGNGMSVNVSPGRCWFNHSWLLNDSILPVTIEPITLQPLSRIDAVVVEINADDAVRLNAIKVVKGVESTNPERPAMTKSAKVHQYPLAYVSVKTGDKAIAASAIVNVVGTKECPFVTGLLSVLTTDEMIVQWQGRFEELFEKLEEQISQAASQTIIDGSVTESKLANYAVSRVYRATLKPGDAWKNSGVDYYQTLSVPGIRATDEPNVDVDLSGAIDNTDAIAISEAFAVYRATTATDSITVRATDLPDRAVPIKIRCIRK